MAIDVTTDAILIDGIATESIAKGLAATGMASADIVNLIGHMYVGYVGGKGKPAFRFSTRVEATDADCEATFARSFDHVDWIDGVSRVQAGMTPEELGFNARFHAIENDLDAIADQFERMSECMGELRADLRGIVGELEAKITDLDAQIQELKSKGSDGGGSVFRPGVWEYLGAAKVHDKDVIVARLGEQIVMSEIMEEMISEGRVTTPPTGGGFVDDRVIDGGGIVFDPGRDVVLPHDGFFIAGDRVVPGHGGAVRLEDMVVLNEALERRVAAGAGERTVREVVDSGDPLVRTVGSGLDADELVTDAGFLNLATERILSSSPETERRALREAVLRDDVAERTGRALLSSGVVGLTSVSESDAEALAAAGFSRIGNLAGATVSEVVSGVEAAGFSLDERRVREAVSGARVARALRRG
jgi:hypothetical protein